MANTVQALFRLGVIRGTPGARDLIEAANANPVYLLARHATGDWGEDLSAEDEAANNAAVHTEERILSSYRVGAEKLWIITEANRSATTLLLPEEY